MLNVHKPIINYNVESYLFCILLFVCIIQYFIGSAVVLTNGRWGSNVTHTSQISYPPVLLFFPGILQPGQNDTISILFVYRKVYLSLVRKLTSKTVRK